MLYLYIISFLLLSAYIFVALSRNKFKNKFKIRNPLYSVRIEYGAFVIFSFVLFILTAFRGKMIGNDTIFYIHFFDFIANSGVNKSIWIESGYQYLVLVMTKIFRNPQLFLIIVATFSYIVTFRFISKYSKDKLLSTIMFLAFLWSFYLSGVRQVIAMNICLLSYEQMMHKKNIIAVVLVLLAAQFHTSAILFLSLFLVKKIKINNYIVFSFIIALSVLNKLGLLTRLISVMFPKYINYLSFSNATQGSFSITMKLLLGSILYFIYTMNKQTEKYNSSKNIEKWAFILSLFSLTFGYAQNQAERISLFFVLTTLISFPNALISLKKYRILLQIISALVFVVYFLVVAKLRPEWNTLYPYVFFWN